MVWAVGDVHGRLDLLAPLIEAILTDLESSTAQRRVVVMLGDYVDRGPASRGVIDLLCDLSERADIETHFLRGNHEDRFEAFLSQPEVGPGWCDYGGREALASYGVPVPALRSAAEDWETACAEINAALPDRHRRFLAGLTYAFALGDYFFAHAGARPGTDLALQEPEDLMWIRSEFLQGAAPFDKLVVHGHTPVDQVHADHRRIGIDTGAYATGVLTGLRLEGARRDLLQARAAGAAISLTAGGLTS